MRVGPSIMTTRFRRRCAPGLACCPRAQVVDPRPGRTDETLMPTGGAFIRATRTAARRAGVQLFDLGDDRQGIVHVISPEQGVVLPGLTIVCPDSHTSTQGAFGALAWGVGSTEAEHALATSTLRVHRPQSLRITVDGRLGPGVSAKDLALHVLARLSASGAQGAVVEYAGSAVEALSMEGRMTLCNMATELSAFGALIAPDAAALAYLQGRPYAPKGEAWDRAASAWLTLKTDEAAAFDLEARFDAAEVAPSITWGTSPQHTVPLNGRVPSYDSVSAQDSRESYDKALAYMGLKADQPLRGLPIDAAFIGSCTNGRITDLRDAAALLRGRKIAPGVHAICVPGSMAVKAQAEAEGLDAVFRRAGFEWREPGCSMCFFAGGESFASQARVVTSTNRNFESRQGPGVRSHLASPATVAAAAGAGRIADPRALSPA